MKRKILFSFMLACISALVFGALNVSADTYGDLTYIIDNEKNHNYRLQSVCNKY